MLKQKFKLWFILLISFCLLYSLIVTPEIIWPFYNRSQSTDNPRPPFIQWIGSFSRTYFYKIPGNYSQAPPSSRNVGRTVMFFNEPLKHNKTSISNADAMAEIDKPRANRQRVNRPVFDYLHTPDNCSDDVRILIAVCSAGQNREQRQTIRNTWGRDAANNSTIKLLFFEGRSLNPSVQEDIAKESETFNDIVQEDFVDRYQNLSLKSIAYLRWVSNRCKNVRFVLKTDDDMYVNIPVLVETLSHENHSRFIMGHVFSHAPPMRSVKSKWYTSVDTFSGKEYPPYVSGTSYVVSGDLISNLYVESFYHKLFWLEDVFITGFLAQAVGATLLHNNKFSFSQRPKKGCYYRNSISGHHVSPRNMRKIYRELKNSELTCTFLTRKEKL